jgi:hypothetical protein
MEGQWTITIASATTAAEEVPVAAFPAPADAYAARRLWVFLVENLRPGFVVGIGDEDGLLTAAPSGSKVPADRYKEIMGSKK